MESRVLSGAATITAGIPRPRRPVRLSSAACSAVADGSGGNLIWGRQLRPAILLESASPVDANLPVTKREILRPCLAAASSPAEDSDSAGDAKVAPVGFFNKYPALVTGFFFFMWYFLNVIFNILNKKIYNYFPYPYFVSVIHLFVGVVYCLVSWTVGLPKRARNNPNGDGPAEGPREPKFQITHLELRILEDVYALEGYPSNATMTSLCQQLGLSIRQLAMWFCRKKIQDQRSRARKRPRWEGNDWGNRGSFDSGRDELVAAERVGVRAARRYTRSSCSAMVPGGRGGL